MDDVFSADTRNILRHSLPAMDANRARIIDGMTIGLACAGDGGGPVEAARAAASALVDLLLSQARLLAHAEELHGLGDARGRLRERRVDGRHFSRFGDWLVPVMRDALTPAPSHAVTSAWSDTFWAIVRAMEGRSIAGDGDATSAAPPRRAQLPPAGQAPPRPGSAE